MHAAIRVDGTFNRFAGSQCFFLIALVAAGLSGCAAPPDSFSNLHRQNGLTPGIHLDPDLSSDESDELREDLAQIRTLPIDGTGVRYFTDIFGGPTSDDVWNYLSDRIHWIVSPRKNMNQSVIELFNLNNPQVVATNIGAAIWYSSIADGAQGGGIQIGSSLIEVTSMRAGVIQLGEGYLRAQADPFLRTSALVHEARHSDCTGGVARKDLDSYRNGGVPGNKQCGHLHVNCPEGHPYEGFPACDDHPWGAYAVEATYMAAVSKECATCTTQQKYMATVVFADAASRVLSLEGLLSGKEGPPDMSSTDSIF